MEKKQSKIIIISGKAESGKNKIADIIENEFVNKNKKVIQISYAYYLKHFAKKIIGWDGDEKTKPRDFLQQIGVELIKNKINNRFLIDRVLDDIKIYTYFFDIIILTDARFKEEIEDIKKLYDDAIVINIYKDSNNLTSEQKKHITETALDNYDKYDYKINNNGSLEELKQRVKKILGDINYE